MISTRVTEVSRVEVDPLILLWAFRYTLYRRSYSELITDALIEHKKKLSVGLRIMVIDEIETAILKYDEDMDVTAWRRVVDEFNACS